MTKPLPSLFAKAETWDGQEQQGNPQTPSAAPDFGDALPDPSNVSHRLAAWCFANVEGVGVENVSAATGLDLPLLRRIKSDKGLRRMAKGSEEPDLLGKSKAQLAVGLAVEKLLQRLHTESDGMTTGEILNIISSLGDRIGFTKQSTVQVAFVDQSALKKIKTTKQVNQQNEFAQAEDITSIVDRGQKAIAQGRKLRLSGEGA